VEEAVVVAFVSNLPLFIVVLANVFIPSVVLRMVRASPTGSGIVSKPVTTVEVMALLFLVVACVSLLMVVMTAWLVLLVALIADHGGRISILTMVVVACLMLIVLVSATRGGGSVTESMAVLSNEASM